MQNGIIPPSRMLILLAWVFFLFSFSAWADFQDMQPAEKVYKPGVSLSFDDDFIELWHKARPIFKEHGARITFFICRYHALSAAKKEMLRDLQADGHEIAYHSVSHIDGKEYLKNHTLQEYLDNEIAPDLKLMNEDNFFPRTFAYPWGGFTPEMDIALKKKFLMLRKSGRLGGKDTILIPGQQKKDIAGASIDFSRFNQEAFDGVIEKIAKDQSGIAILYTHRITEARVPQSHIIIEDLVKLLQKIREKGLTFYTFSELAPEVAPGKELIYQSLEKGTVDKANLLMADSWPVDRFPDIYLPGGPTWNEDPYGEKYWRFLFYALRPLGNLIYGWKKTGDLKYLKKSREFIISFMENNALEKPPLTDPHTSAFLSMMLVSFGIKLEREGLFSPDQSALFLKGLRNRALFLSDDDNYEGDYNHGLTEALALFLIGEMYPYLASSEEWKTLALKRLALTIQGTVDTDGAEVEQSPFYHYYVLKFFWEIEKWAKQYSVDLPGLPLEDIIKLMMTFGGYMVQPDGLTPDMGSSTRFNLYEDRICKEMAPLNSFFTYVYTKGKKGEAPQQSSRLFSTAGFSVLRTPFQSSSFSDATHILFDVGPYRTNHSQLDALNFTFYASRPLLVDSGLFTYEKGEKHDYYAGTSAHNTIVVDGLTKRKGMLFQASF